jgi:transposase
MLSTEVFVPLTEFERQLFGRLVPEDHFLRQLERHVDFERFRPTLEQNYAPQVGRPALDPVRMFKLDLLAVHYRWSDRELMRQVQVNMAHRLFVNLGSESVLPHHTSMTYFRARIGAETLQEVFHGVLGQARDLGLVKDRLRLKDATHIIANIAIPSTIQLVATMRDRVLDAAQPFAPDEVKREWTHADVVCAASEDLPDTERLVRRVQHLRSVLLWADALPQSEAFRAGTAADQDALREALTLAHKVLADREEPQASDKVVSVHDPDARCGKHGAFFDGYLADVTMDADSELLTGINVLPANGDEGGDAAYLIAQEEAAHGNDVEQISIDGAGFRGPVLRELTDPAGLHLEVFTPPTQRPPVTVFGPEDFTLSQDKKTLTCPAGQMTTSCERNTNDTGVKFRFAKTQCAGCALRDQCLADPKTKSRTVIKNDYEAEYQAAQAKAQTPEYAQVRQEHPAIERKLSELVRRHDLRHARYRGLSKVLRQALLTGIAVNLKRMVKLSTPATLDPDKTRRVRAHLVAKS